ncbi:hypothetical protein D9611_004090 [Ephemerocybe angulata]|uniref:Polysaccharide lyase 14 domain-containing protein n=1 Tax=Ephemerocybe angulata TaxID=980116 RepID=A0A8H5BKT7_9AGAR|nr:hypothetical protein D9611_004090 [Tulosesus angulatus]
MVRTSMSRFTLVPHHLALLVAFFCAAVPLSHGWEVRSQDHHHRLANRDTQEVLSIWDVQATQLFPKGPRSSSWSTFPGTSGGDTKLPLEPATLVPFKVLQSTTAKYTTLNGKKVIKAHYPKGSYTFGHNPQGGFSFYAKGPVNRLDLTTAKEVTFGYSVYFPRGFAFQKGGKMPGIYGGDNDDKATGCSGGRRDNGCFSSRIMWRAQGDGELYTYLPPESPENKKVCNVPPFSECNGTYGASVGRGSFKFATGQWTVVAMRVKLNDVGQANGELQLWANGESKINVKGLVLRTSRNGRIRGMQWQTFFGGSSTSFATPKDQDVYFSDVSLAITQKL